MDTMMDCKTSQAQFADFLLDPEYAAAHPAMATHLSNCTACGQEMAELRETMAILDAWEAPEPSAYFDTRLYARLREAQAEAPASLWERARAWWTFSSGRSFGARPAMAGALALVMLVGGGTYATFHSSVSQPAAAVNGAGSATVNDLKLMDNNAEALQQMDQLLNDNGQDDGDNSPAT